MRSMLLTARPAALVLVALLSTTTGFAHGGGLDKCGGHNDHKHGGYHVHNRAAYCACNPSADGCGGASSAAAKPPVSQAAPSTNSPTKTATGTAKAAQTVYVTKTGAKYHRAGCSSLAKSSIPMPLGEASAKYGACSRCNPPTLGTGPVASSEAVAPPAASTIPKSRQCAAITKKGTRCSRTAAEGSAYCWQHAGSQ